MNVGDDLHKTWNDLSQHWDDWGPPLRPCPEDLQITRRALERWHAADPVETPRVFLCGVTPEIATMPWPFPIELTGMDQSEGMVRSVWPGDIPGVRRAIAGNWLRSGLPPHSQDVVIGDGGFAFFDFPDGMRALAAALRELLRPRGLFVYRHYAQAPQRESPPGVIEAMRAGRIGNFHIFKWRVAMALQHDSARGVRQHDIWQACMDACIDPAKLPQPGWSRRAVDTIRFYRDKESRLYFPTADEFRALVTEVFDNITMEFPGYELGDRCPVFTARCGLRGTE